MTETTDAVASAASRERSDGRPLSTAVVEAVAAAAGRPATDPGFVLADAVDPDALDALSDGEWKWSVEFPVDRWTVAVTHDGSIDVREDGA